MKTKILIFCLCSLLLAGCSPATTDQANVPTSSVTSSVTSSITSSVTPSPAPTHTPAPTEIPEIISLEDYTPAEPYFEHSGSGDDVITEIVTESYSYLNFFCGEDGYKSIKAHYDDTYDLLVNTTDEYSGSTLLHPETEYTIEINAAGPWELQIYNIGTSSTDVFSGENDWVSPVFISSSDVYEINADGDGHFAVRGYYDNGDYDLLVNTTDSYSGKVMFNQEGNYCFFEVTSEREWSIQPK